MKNNPFMKTEETFTDLMRSFGARNLPRRAFDHFLDVLIAGLSPEPVTVARFDLNEYGLEDQEIFPRLVHAFTAERNRRAETGENPDILGEFFELHVAKAPNCFLPWPVCQGMARELRIEDASGNAVVDHACGSGRILLALTERLPADQPLYGVAEDWMNAKMAAITLFCSGVRTGEIVVASFVGGNTHYGGGYTFVSEPPGVLAIREDDSKLWKRHMEVIRDTPMASEMDADGSPLTEGLQIRFW